MCCAWGISSESRLAAFDSDVSVPGYFRGSSEGAEKTSPDDGTLWRSSTRFMGEARLVSSMLFPSSKVSSIISPASASSSLASLQK